EQEIRNSRGHIRQLNNGYWLAHRAFNSKAKVVYGTVYNIPKDIGLVDISVISSVLLHVRDPFLALQNALQLTLDTVIIVERSPENIKDYPDGPYMRFLPEPSIIDPRETWWVLSPGLIKKFLGVLGFDEVEVKHHFQLWQGARLPLYTIVGHRTRR